jgi:hypothetical protein
MDKTVVVDVVEAILLATIAVGAAILTFVIKRKG